MSNATTANDVSSRTARADSVSSRSANARRFHNPVNGSTRASVESCWTSRRFRRASTRATTPATITGDDDVGPAVEARGVPWQRHNAAACTTATNTTTDAVARDP